MNNFHTKVVIFFFRYTASEALDILLAEEDFVDGTITLLPPSNGQQSDEDSADEDRLHFDHLSRNQLIAPAEVEIDYGSHSQTTIENITESLEVTQKRRKSARLSNKREMESDNEHIGLFSSSSTDEEAESSQLHHPLVQGKWLSSQTPPLPPTNWNECDLTPKVFINPPERRESFSPCTPFGLFNLFFDDEVIDFIVDQTNLYARRDKGFTNFGTDSSEIRLFLAVLLLSGYNRRPRLKMYWDESPDIQCPLVANLFTRKRFRDILTCLHLCDNLELDKTDKMTKMRPFYNLINERCLKFRENVPHLAVDEAMIAYFGKNHSKQRIQNKPVRVGYKMWVLAEESGYIVQFDPYQGAKSNGPQRSTPRSWGLGEMTVLELVEKMPKDISYHIFVDNFFSSVRLMKFLGDKNIKASGTLRQNRISKDCTIARRPFMDKTRRGHVEQQTAADNSATILGWKDNKVVYFTSNSDGKSPEVAVERYCRDSKGKIMVQQPQSIYKYNQYMGGVDRADQNISCYRIAIRSNKWWWSLFSWVPDMIVQNAWILYKRFKSPTDPNHDLLDFRREIVAVYISKYSKEKASESTSSSRLSTSMSKRPVSNDVRFDRLGHFSERSDTTKRCAKCGNNTKKWCRKCGKGLHDKCFNDFHGF